MKPGVPLRGVAATACMLLVSPLATIPAWVVLGVVGISIGWTADQLGLLPRDSMESGPELGPVPPDEWALLLVPFLYAYNAFLLVPIAWATYALAERPAVVSMVLASTVALACFGTSSFALMGTAFAAIACANAFTLRKILP